MYFVYVLKSINHNKTYVGYTNNLNRRIDEHNKGKSKFTRTYKPWGLIYKEEYPTISEAKKREKYLKSSAGRIYLKKIIT
ncbi:MAG: endonuclease [Ignavibacteriales bacterium CG12_big_fil_rev_8_21_14_0_65_30_8]|nr:MAG: endonuclease [Ignavibacteriales bacterium CG12_big_fil_rev_8_21_14_0_65_30_8]